jgi:hypothetical protein
MSEGFSIQKAFQMISWEEIKNEIKDSHSIRFSSIRSARFLLIDFL